MSESRCRKNEGCVYNVHLHFVWCPKYRRPVLVDEVADTLRQLLDEKASRLSIEIKALEIMPDHVHLFASVPPTDAPQFYANQFKGYTSRILQERFAHLRTMMPSLWSRSYYVGSNGHVSAETVKLYIAAQETRT